MIRDHEARASLSPTVVRIRGVVALALLAGLVWWMVSGAESGRDAGLRLSLLALYLFVAFWFVPEPDTSNLGWFGGLMNNPFRFSDNINRMLLWFRILLAPGAFVAIGVWDLLRSGNEQQTLMPGAGDPDS